MQLKNDWPPASLHLKTSVCMVGLLAVLGLALWQLAAAGPVLVPQSRLLTGTNFTYTPGGRPATVRPAEAGGQSQQVDADEEDLDRVAQATAGEQKHEVGGYNLDVPRILKGFGLGGGKWG